MNLKKCAKCSQEKDRTLFAKDITTKDGYRSYCTECNRERARAASIIRKPKRHSYNQSKSSEISEYNKIYFAANKSNINQYKQKRYNTDPQFKLAHILRIRIIKAIKANSIRTNSIKLLGCTIKEYKEYIENKWADGMSWDNHSNKKGGWEIDHIKPCAAFDLIDIEQQKQCFHYTNTQPLWFEDNRTKADKI